MSMLAASFFITAVLYASVGFGGGSTYNALLVLAETDYQILPSIALVCNLIVVSGGTWRFARAGHIPFKRTLPWIITSVPAALMGGHMAISETFFIGLLGFSLLLAGIRMFWPKNNTPPTIHQYRFAPPILGGTLGLLAGLVGIGGGIFLAPVLHLLRWDTTKGIAGTCSLFIFVNSAAGLSGQLIKADNTTLLNDIGSYWPLFLVVLVGGHIGSYLGAVRLEPKIIHRMTALLILYVSMRLIWRWGQII